MAMNHCIDCGKPVSAGHSGINPARNIRCLPCETKRILRNFNYPASQSMQALRRERKEREHGDRKNHADA